MKPNESAEINAGCWASFVSPIYVLPYLCSDGVCQGGKDCRPLYFDDDHLSEYGNKLLVPMFEKVFVGWAE